MRTENAATIDRDMEQPTMTMNPVKAVRAKIEGAIDWRVDRAFDQRSPKRLPDDARQQLELLGERVERNLDEIAGLRALLAEISSSLSDQDRALGDLVEQLARRISTLSH